MWLDFKRKHFGIAFMFLKGSLKLKLLQYDEHIPDVQWVDNLP